MHRLSSLSSLIPIAVMAIWSGQPGPSDAAERAFRQHVINAESEHNACAVVDVNQDGQPDIVAGEWWYEAPTWKKHFVRSVERIRGRFDDYAHLVLDVNGDDWPDLISANYRSQSIYWVENPGPAGGEWPQHEVARPGPMETGRLADVDGDGQLDLLPNGTKFAAWWQIDRSAAADDRWVRHDLPPELAGHGVGIGDLNGDGRADLVCPRGWAEAPQDRIGERWVFRPDFQLDRDGSIPILVWDVDQDGDQDIVWGRGHQIGVYWLEQVGAASGREWRRHAIDTSWSQPHSLLAADIDDDGEIELVAGKRYLGHDGKDPGELDPLAAYWYDFDPEQRVWHRHVIAEPAAVGFGLDPKAADIDGDGDLDLVFADRNGLGWYENLLHGGSYADRAELMVYQDAAGASQPVTSPTDWAQRRADILHGMQAAMGPLPGPSSRVALDVQIVGEEDLGSYVRRKVTFAVEPGDRLPAYLLIPKEVDAPVPAMLCLHPTTKLGKDEVAGVSGRPSRQYGRELAERGYVCLVPDYPSFGEYPYAFRESGRHYASGSMKAIWNNLRAVDLLLTLPEVDRDRIGAIGHSLGGHNSLFTAVFDQRIRAVITSCGFTPFHDYYEGRLAGWTSDRYMPRIRSIYENDPDRMPFDFYEVLAALAPRPVFVSAPEHDSNFAVAGVRKVEAQVRPLYTLLGAGDRLRFDYPDCEHDFPQEMREAAYEWLDEMLRRGKAP